jgi:hypothetical protein
VNFEPRFGNRKASRLLLAAFDFGVEGVEEAEPAGAGERSGEALLRWEGLLVRGDEVEEVCDVLSGLGRQRPEAEVDASVPVEAVAGFARRRTRSLA